MSAKKATQKSAKRTATNTKSKGFTAEQAREAHGSILERDHPIVARVLSDRKGIYALEGVDLFNLLCLPGITDPGVLADADAYCHERRAFFIVDARSFTSFTRKLCFTHGRVMPTVSHSWKASWPIACVGTWPVMMTSGIESM